MTHYDVVEVNPLSADLALRDDAGRIHLVRVVAPVPVPGSKLLGEPPALGVKSMQITNLGQSLAVAFVLLDCDEQAVRTLLQASLGL